MDLLTHYSVPSSSFSVFFRRRGARLGFFSASAAGFLAAGLAFALVSAALGYSSPFGLLAGACSSGG